MGRRGPKPQPAKLRLVHGNPGKRPSPATGKGPAPARPKMPAWLGKSAKAKWRLLVPELERLGILTVVDGDVLAAYCAAWEEFEAATKVLLSPDSTCGTCSVPGGRYVLRGTGGLTAHPAVAQQRSAWKAIQSFAGLLALSPAVRRGWLGGEAEEAADPLEEWIGGPDQPA